MKLEWRSYYGIYIVAGWSAILGLVSWGRFFISWQQISEQFVTPSWWDWLYVGLMGMLGLAFIVAGGGLWRFTHWGRRLFLLTAVFFFSLSFISLMLIEVNTPNQLTLWEKIGYTGRYLASMLLPAIYLRLPRVKRFFK